MIWVAQCAMEILYFRFAEIHARSLAIPSHREGRIAIVMNAGRAVVNATVSCAQVTVGRSNS